MSVFLHESSFRDNCGYIFVKDGVVYRRINIIYKDAYDKLMNSGLYQKLVEENLLIKHEIVEIQDFWDKNSYLTIKPEQLNFISFPYEWCFSQLKDAALATLKIAKIALEYGMVLRDASAFNIQFVNNKPVLIDSLSFGINYNKPWVAYGQFCRHFLAPLLLAKYVDLRLIKYFSNEIDGFPLDLTSKLLPYKTKFNFSTFIHIHLHSKTITKYNDKKTIGKKKDYNLSVNSLNALYSSLFNKIFSLKTSSKKNTEWASYYDDFSYNNNAFINKKQKVQEFLIKSKQYSEYLVDLGANDGEFSRIGLNEGFFVISSDIDYGACEINYQKTKINNEQNIIPLLTDLSNPTPAIGFNNTERNSFINRISEKQPVILALALIHHLSISNNLPFNKTASFFASLGKALIIEFVPKFDSQTQKLLVSREDIFDYYSKENFEKVYSQYFNIQEYYDIPETDRTLYLMIRKN